MNTQQTREWLECCAMGGAGNYRRALSACLMLLEDSSSEDSRRKAREALKIAKWPAAKEGERRWSSPGRKDGEISFSCCVEKSESFEVDFCAVNKMFGFEPIPSEKGAPLGDPVRVLSEEDARALADFIMEMLGK